jgi:hypothetical protein
MRTGWMVFVALTALATAPGCGDDSGARDDAGDTADMQDEGGGDVGADADADADTEASADVPAEADADAVADVEEDTPVEADSEAGADVEEDTPADADVDAGDASSALAVTMTASSAYLDLMPGGASSHASFTLQFVNGGSTDATGAVVPDGDVSATDGSGVVFTFTSPTLTVGGGAFSGTIAAGATVDVAGTAMHVGGASGTNYDHEVKVGVHVSWDGATATFVSGAPITLNCVY